MEFDEDEVPVLQSLAVEEERSSHESERTQVDDMTRTMSQVRQKQDV